MENIGKYKVIKELGKGATAVVYLCEDPDAQRQVAVKLAGPATSRPSATDLALVKAVKSIMTGSDDEAKERLLAIVTKWKESKTPVEGKPKTDDYEAGQLSQLQIALNARCNGLDWTGDALNIYGQMATKCPK